MKRALSVFFKGAGMGAADAVPGVSGGTIAFVTGIYEELIETIKRFGPSAIGVWRQQGVKALWQHLTLAFLLPLAAGILASLISVAHLVTWLMEAQPLLLNAFFFGLVVCSGVVVARRITGFRVGYLVWLVLGLVLASQLPSLLPAGTDAPWVIVAGGAIAISAIRGEGHNVSDRACRSGTNAPSKPSRSATTASFTRCSAKSAASWREGNGRS